MKTEDDVRQFILEQSEAQTVFGKGSLADWSRRLGRNHAYLHQYVTRGTPRRLNDDVRRSLAQIMGVLEDDLRSGSPFENSATGRGANVAPPSQNTSMVRSVSGFAKIPIRGQAVGGNQDVLIFAESDNFGAIEAPPILSDVPNAYAVYVVGDLMLERFRHGEIAFVHPYKAPQCGDDVVVQMARGEGEPHHGYVRRFVSWDNEMLKLEQLNPRKTLSLPSSQVKHVGLIVMSGRG